MVSDYHLFSSKGLYSHSEEPIKLVSEIMAVGDFIENGKHISSQSGSLAGLKSRSLSSATLSSALFSYRKIESSSAD